MWSFSDALKGENTIITLKKYKAVDYFNSFLLKVNNAFVAMYLIRA